MREEEKKREVEEARSKREEKWGRHDDDGICYMLDDEKQTKPASQASMRWKPTAKDRAQAAQAGRDEAKDRANWNSAEVVELLSDEEESYDLAKYDEGDDSLIVRGQASSNVVDLT